MAAQRWEARSMRGMSMRDMYKEYACDDMYICMS